MPREREKLIAELQYAKDTIPEEEMNAYRQNLDSLG